MSLLRLILSGLRFHWRSHLGSMLGAVLCATVMTGALLVGDSLRGTLRSQAVARVGLVNSALSAGEKLFRSALAEDVGRDAAAVLQLRGSVTKADGSARLNQTQVLGVDSRFWGLSLAADRRELQPGDGVVSAALAQRLGVVLGDEVVLRVEKPSLFSRDAPLSGEEEVIESLRIRIVAIADDAHFGRFSLQANQVPPATIFVPLETLQRRLDVSGKANLLLSASLDAPGLKAAVSQKWNLTDAGLQIKDLNGGLDVEVRTPQVFIESKLFAKLPVGEASLTYFVNSVGSGDLSTPYSMVTAARPGSLPFFPADLRDDEIVVSEWLAKDLGVEVGRSVDLSYYVMGAHRSLEERKHSFTVRAIVPLGTAGWDSSWMPDFPGLADVGNCRDWKPGFALSLDKIRDKDEVYWKTHRGTPKAFISLNIGREMWGNRWGALTAVRYSKEGFNESEVLKRISPADVGFQFLPLRQLSTEALDAPVDFAGLFGGFSFFLIVSALSLVGLLFGLMVEKRGIEAGTLFAMGWSPEKVRMLFLGEGLISVFIGAVAGGLLGFVYTQCILVALKSVWSGASAGVEISFYAAPRSLVVGILGSVLSALFAMMIVCRRSWNRPARQLLAGESFESVMVSGSPRVAGRWSRWVAGLSGGGGGLLSAIAVVGKQTDPELFFCGGMLLLVSLLTMSRWFLALGSSGQSLSICQLSWRNIGRRTARGAVLVGVLASGAFLVLSVEVFRKGELPSPLQRGAGTGGFSLIGQLASPVYEDLNQPGIRDSLGLPNDPAVHVLMLREKEGDEASCLNLNRAVKPRVLGVPSAELDRLGAFRFAAKSTRWSCLKESGEGWIPAVADEATIQWALQKKIGDTLSVPDGQGGMVRIKLVGALSGSILQGMLLVDESVFERTFPNLGGYRVLLLDAPAADTEAVRANWSRALVDRGLELVSTTRRLAELDAVSNTYLSIFQVLGGLGVLLGALGVGVVAARNVVERRAELAILEAIGWRRGTVRKLLMWEQAVLILSGGIVGALCTLIVTLPNQWIRGESIHGAVILWSIVALLLLSQGVAWLAIRISLPSSVIGTLRSE